MFLEKRPKIDEIFRHDFLKGVLMKTPNLSEVRIFKSQCVSIFIQREQMLAQQKSTLLENNKGSLFDAIRSIPF